MSALADLALRCAAATHSPDLSELDVTILTPYAVQMRYDPEFWPDQVTAQEALDLATQVRAAVLAVLPSSVHP